MRNETKHTVRVLSSGVLAALVFDPSAMAQQSGTVRIIVLALAICTAAATAQTITFFRQFTTPAIDQPTAVAANASGIYVIGNRQSSPVGAGISKYDSLGNELWTREVGVPEPGIAVPSQVHVDATGVYVHGYIRDQYFGAGRRFLRKYTTGGDELWTHFLMVPLTWLLARRACTRSAGMRTAGT